MRAFLPAAVVLAAAGPARGDVLKPPPGARLQIGVDASKRDAALSPDGALLAVVDGAGGVQLIDVAKARSLAVRADLGCSDSGCSALIAFARDSKRVAVYWKPSNKLHVLDPAGKTLWSASVDAKKLRFLDDGRLVAIGYDETYAFTPTGARITLYTPEAGEAIDDVSPDGTQIAIDTTRIIDMKSKAEVRVPSASLSALMFGVRERLIGLTAGDGPEVVTWKRGDTQTSTLATSMAGDSVNGLALPPPYDRVYVGLDSGLRGFALEGGAQVIHAPWLASQPLGADAIGRSGDKLVVRNGACAQRLDAAGLPVLGPVTCAHRPIALAFDGARLIALPAKKRIVHAYDTRSGALVAASPIGALHPQPEALAQLVRDPALAARIDKAFALPGVPPGPFQLSGKRLFVGARDGGDAAIVELGTLTARSKLRAFVASGDGRRSARRKDGSPTEVEVRALGSDALLATLPLPPAPWLRLSHDGSLVVTPTSTEVLVTSVATRKTSVFACRLSPGSSPLSANNRRLACDTADAVVVYDLVTRKLVKRIPHPASGADVDAVALSADGRRLAIASGNIVIVDL